MRRLYLSWRVSVCPQRKHSNACLPLLIGALVILAGWQWQRARSESQLAEKAAAEATAQRDRAEQALSLATDTARSLISERLV